MVRGPVPVDPVSLQDGRAGGPSREALRAHLVRSRIAGDVATPRDNNLGNCRRMSSRDPHYLFGLEPRGAWTYEDVARLMVQRVGIDSDLSRTSGPDTIDPDLTIDRLEAMRDRLAAAARDRQRVLLGTGHPDGVFAIHAEVGAALRAAGCTVLEPAAGWSYESEEGRRLVRYVRQVAVVTDGSGHSRHTHDPEPMRAMLAALAAAGELPPDLVVADHGFAGAAGQAGIDSVGYADCNDPALFVGEAEGTVLVSVPLDDNVAMRLYEPLTAFLLSGWAS